MTLLITAQNNAALIAVAAPLVGAALAVLFPPGRWAAAPAIIAATVSAIAAGDLAVRMLSAGAAAPIAESGFGFRLDGAGVMAGALIALFGALLALTAPAHLGRGATTPFGVSLFLIALAGFLGAAYAGDVVSLFLALETALLACIALGALGPDDPRGALSGSFRLLLYNGVASCLFLVGAALAARAFGGASFGDFAAARLSAQHAGAIGGGLMLLALAAKAGAAPLHAWAGAFYGRASSLGVATFGVLGVIALYGAIIRVAGHIFAAPAIGEVLAPAVLALGLVSVVMGSLQAAGARDLRRLAGYAAAAQAGCLLVAVAMGSPAAVASALVQLCAIGVAALALLTAAPNPAPLAALDGLGRRAPLTSLAITAGALSLMGAPLTLGFLGRWRLIEAGVGGGWWWAAGAVIVTSLAAVFYGGRVIERLYFRRAAVAQPASPWRVLLAPALIVAAVGALYGAYPEALLRAADAAAHLLTGGAT